MKYLDAKKRLALMMATAKYIRLKMNGDPAIQVTNDDIKVAIARAIAMLPKDYTITMEDVAIVRDGVRSLLLEMKYNVAEIKDNVKLETHHYDTIKSNDYIKFKEYLNIQGLQTTSLQLGSLLDAVTVLGIIDLATDHADHIIADSKIKSTAELKINPDTLTELSGDDAIISDGNLQMTADNSTGIIANEALMMSNYTKLDTSKLTDIQVSSAIKFSSSVYLELEEIKSTIATDSYIKLNEASLLSLVKTLLIRTDSKLITKDNANIAAKQAVHIISDNSIISTGKTAIDYLLIISMSLLGNAKLVNSVKVNPSKSVSIQSEETILSQFSTKLVDSMARYLWVDDAVLTSGEMSMEFEEFITVEFEIDSLTKLSEVVELNKAFPIPTEIIAKLFVPNEVKLSLLHGADIAHDYTISVKDSVTLGRFKYSILQNWDEEKVSTMDNLILDDLIYITT